MILFYPYKLGSVSAKTLAREFNSKRIKPFGRYRAKYRDLVVNWGNSTIPYWYARILNKPEAVAIAANKLKTFQKLKEHNVSTPEWTDQRTKAVEWVQSGTEIYARRVLSGNSGRGIVVCTTPESVVDAPLYTKRVKAKYEFRIHVFKNGVIDVQQKKRRNGVEANNYIRNLSNGYIYARADVQVPEIVSSTAIAGVKALGLDFGAVDIGYVERDNKAFIYEINTAPGIMGTTIEKYKAAIKSYYITEVQ